MNRILISLSVLLSGLLPAVLWAVGSRVGGDAEVVYESLGAGGAAFASYGAIKLGGSVGQANLVYIATNDQGEVFLNGFWEAEESCVLYNPTITELTQTGGFVGVTFLVVKSNTYQVSYVTEEEGGLMLGTHAITNALQTFIGEGGAGSATTIWHNVSASTNRALYYVIRCE